MTTNHPAHGPVSLDRLHQIREILSKAAAQSDGGNLGYAMADAVKVIDGAIAAFGADPVIVVGDDGADALSYRRLIQSFAPGTKLYAAPQLPQPAVVEIGEIRVGRLPTMNQDDYPGLGEWWVQLRIGEDSDEVLARVYGATPREANNRAEALACRAAMLQAEPASNSDELPLDYLQGHKDGLAWAAQMAEANHPQTGDWLYDDPIELARAIRKGPDMPEFKSVSVDEDDNFYSWFGRFWYENYQKNNYTTSAKQMLGTMAEFAYRAGRESAALAANSPVTPSGGNDEAI